MADYLRLIGRDTAGNRCDVTRTFAEPRAFARLLNDLTGQLTGGEVNLVAAVDALVSVLGTAIALRRRAGLALAREGGKLPVTADAVEFVDYTGDRESFELQPYAVPAS